MRPLLFNIVIKIFLPLPPSTHRAATDCASEPLAVRGGTLAIDPERDGPLVVTGNLEICAGTGRTVDRVTRARLCRCGGSANKPFCDGTHRRIGFSSTG